MAKSFVMAVMAAVFGAGLAQAGAFDELKAAADAAVSGSLEKQVSGNSSWSDGVARAQDGVAAPAPGTAPKAPLAASTPAPKNNRGIGGMPAKVSDRYAQGFAYGFEDTMTPARYLIAGGWTASLGVILFMVLFPLALAGGFATWAAAKSGYVKDFDA